MIELQKCPEMKRSSINERWQLVRESRLCFNCLRPANSFHYSMICRQPRCSAEWCGQRNHRLQSSWYRWPKCRESDTNNHSWIRCYRQQSNATNLTADCGSFLGWRWWSKHSCASLTWLREPKVAHHKNDVDILIRADYYFLFAKGNCQKCATANSPTVFGSTFG